MIAQWKLRQCTGALGILFAAMVGAWADRAWAQPPTTPVAAVDPIDGGLGLADVRVTLPEPASSPRLVVRPTDSLPNGIRIPLRRVGAGAYAGRVFLGASGGGPREPRIARLKWTDGAGTQRRAEVELRFAPPDGRSTPSWAKGRVWYQIMPERFANGMPANDPAGLEVTPRDWDDPWGETDLAEIERAWARRPLGERIDPDAAGGIRDQVIWHRRYGGDLIGVGERLAALESLGVTGIYFTPIFHAASLHKYEATDHRHVDPTFGPPEAGALDRTPRAPVEPAREAPFTAADRYVLETLLPRARAGGMRVILDGVWNHVGTEHWAFRDVVRRGERSAYASWFDVRFNEAGELVGWGAWDGPNGDLPEFRQNERGEPVEPAREHVMGVTRRWMDPDGDGDPSDGIDGWRLDVVPDLGVAFWRRWHELVRRLNPEAVTVSEIWSPAPDMLGGGLFDAQMNYPIARAVTAWLGRRPEYTSQDLAADLKRIRLESAAHELTQMNLLVSHDTERLASMLMNPGRGYDRGGSVLGESDYDLSAPSERVLDRCELGFAMLAAWPGAPMVYAGEEWAMIGGDDPDNRRPIQRPGITGSGEAAYGSDAAFRARVRRWLRLRSQPVVGPVLRYGSTRLIPSGDADLFGFVRRLNGVEVLIGLNRGEKMAELGWASGDETVRVPPRSAIWRVRKPADSRGR